MVLGTAVEVPAGTFKNPINNGPDPWMCDYQGNYYLATTQGDSIRLWKAPTLRCCDRNLYVVASECPGFGIQLGDPAHHHHLDALVIAFTESIEHGLPDEVQKATR